MLANFGSIAPYFKFKPTFISIDNLVFKFHYKWSFGILLVCTVLVTSRQYIGDHINCLTGTIDAGVVNTFCFFTTTFTLIRHMNDSALAAGVATYPGVGPFAYREDPVKHHAYYQWVPFVLFGEALLFYMPHYFWKSLEGGQIKSLVDGLHMTGISVQMKTNEGIDSDGRHFQTSDELAGRIKTIKTTYINRLRANKYWGFYLCFCETLNLVVTILVIFSTNRFLAGEFYNLGKNVMHENWLGKIDALDVVFPKMTKCNFHKFGPSGSIQNHDVLCLMGLNIINEKIFTFLWFWFVFMFVVSVLALFWRVFSWACHRSTKFNVTVLQLNVLGRLNRDDISTVFRKVSFSNSIFLHYLAGNLEWNIFKTVLAQLATEFGNIRREEKQNRNNHFFESNVEGNHETEPLKVDTVDSANEKSKKN